MVDPLDDRRSKQTTSKNILRPHGQWGEIPCSAARVEAVDLEIALESRKKMTLALLGTFTFFRCGGLGPPHQFPDGRLKPLQCRLWPSKLVAMALCRFSFKFSVAEPFLNTWHARSKSARGLAHSKTHRGNAAREWSARF